MFNIFKRFSSKKTKQELKLSFVLSEEEQMMRNAIIESELFDAEWYNAKYKNITQSDYEPVAHYILYGAAEGRDPSAVFSSAKYHQEYPDTSNFNPLFHYIEFGINEGRNRFDSDLVDYPKGLELLSQSGLFDEKWYQSRYPQVSLNNFDALTHFFSRGWRELKSPSADFDTEEYLKRYPDVAESGLNPVLHYIQFGQQEGRVAPKAELKLSINDVPKELKKAYKKIHKAGVFDANYYRQVYPDVRNAEIDPIVHYLQYGVAEYRNPSDKFNTRFYLTQMTKREIKKYNPLEHYVIFMNKRELQTSPSSQKIAQALVSGKIFGEHQIEQPGSIAVMIHIFYPELCDVIGEYLSRIPYSFDLLISTDTEEKANQIWKAFSSLSKLGELNLKVVENRGRDIAPMIIDFGDELLKYDFALHLHSKKSPYGSKLGGWLKYSLDNLLHSEAYIDRLLAMLKQDDMGALYPMAFPAIMEHLHWEDMKKDGELFLSNKLGIDKNILKEFSLEFPAGSMFWFKPAALEALFSVDIKRTEFPDESGQMNSTLAHVIERLFLYVCHHHGYRFQSIRPAFENESFLSRRVKYNPDVNYVIPSSNKPKVSIIIPVYNQWEYTAACLVSIIEHTDFRKTSYEIILADDCSSDETINATSLFKGLKVERTPENYGFLQNCNNAAQAAIGEYVLFLNNDTQVQMNWLSSMFDLFDKDESIAIVGSKLIYSDDTLQEAGGVIWRNAGGLNYGRNHDHPESPEFCYVKESDYISGASLLVKQTFWKQVGGFDERYIPAYYEDTDICFEARDKGYKAVFQPASQVIHFEGKSHGTDENAGIKAYQQENKVKFLEKWQQTLELNHYDGSVIKRARERSVDKKVVAIIDYLLPEYDRHAGARHTWDYLRLLVDKGFVVKFIACKVDDIRQLKFARELEQMGIETIYPDVIGIVYEWNSWLSDNQDYLDMVVFHRPAVAKKHMQTTKDLGVKTLYFCHDLQSLRDWRVAMNSGDQKLAKEIKSHEHSEIEIFKNMDFSFTPSIYEKEYLADTYQVTNVEAIPLYLEKDVSSLKPLIKKPSKNQITFVGGMKHLPNKEGVAWFIKEVAPSINDSITINIVGTDVPDSLLKLSSDYIVFHGGVSDQKLTEIYQNTTVIIIPLLSGAGVKGKVIEAFKHGIPLVSTSIGLEGIRNVEEILEPNDKPQKFAESINALVELSEDDWLKKSLELQNFFTRNYCFESGWKAVSKGFGESKK